MQGLKYVFIIILIGLIAFAGYSLYSKPEEGLSENMQQIVKEEDYTQIITTLRLGICNYDTMNPLLSKNKNIQYYSKLIFEPLFGINEDFSLKQCLATECSRTGDKTYLIKLRKDVKWQDGNPFTAKDVKYTIDVLKSGINSIYSDNVRSISGLEVIDDYTLRVSVFEQIPFFEYNLIFPIMPEHYYFGVNFADDPLTPIGTGMFKIENRTTSYIKLVRNEEWWNSTNLPKLEGITINVYLDAGELYNAFKIGNVDMLVTENDNYAEYVGTIGFETKEFKGREYDFIAINQNNNILSRKEVRQAMNYAIDKNNIVASVFNNKCYVVNNSLDYGSWLYKDASNLSEYNLENAQKALQDNGWNLTSRQWTKIENYRTIKTSFNLFVNSSNNRRVQVAENIRAQLENFGITLNVKALNDNQYNSYLEKKNYDLIITGLNLSFSPNLATFYGNNNLANYNNEEVNKLYSSILNISDKKLLKEKIHEIQNITNDDIIYIPLYINKITLLYSSDLVGDVNPNWYNIFYNIEKWYRKN
ncbi:MAG: hypothetical protein IJ223_04705 [Clostridia bacterium]|nr:hypothetical protein [Clostridia bacterium]